MTVVTPTLKSSGGDFDPTWQVTSIDVTREVNRIPRAQIRLSDGDATTRTWPASDSAFFEPGQEVEILLRWEGEGDDATVFKGLVMRQTVEADRGGAVLVVDLKDAAVKLTGARKSAVFEAEKTDGEILQALVEDAGLTAGTFAATPAKHPGMVQYHATDWDFLLARAEANGLSVVVVDGAVSALAADLSAEPQHVLDWGVDPIYEFELAADAGHQLGAVEGVAWSLADQALTAASASAFELAQSDLDPTAVATAVGFASETLNHPVPIAAEEVQAWADARMVRSRLAMLRGRLSRPGLAAIVPFEVLELQGVGARFSGKTLITGVRHRVDGRGWVTDVQFGLSPEQLTRKPDVPEPPAAGLLPGVDGLQIGKVADFEDDPEGEARVRVLLPGVDSAATSAVWARLATPDAGAERGFAFRPEPGDEVVVGFLNNDPRHPVILGALWGSVMPPPAGLEPTAENELRAIVSRGGCHLTFLDQEKPVASLFTPAGNLLLLDDDGEAVTLADQHGNTILLSADGVTITSAKDLTLDGSKGAVTIKGKTVDIV